MNKRQQASSEERAAQQMLNAQMRQLNARLRREASKRKKARRAQ